MHQGHRHICLSPFIASLQLLDTLKKIFYAKNICTYVIANPDISYRSNKCKVCAEIRTAEKDWISTLFHSSSPFLKVALSQKVFHLGLNLPKKS